MSINLTRKLQNPSSINTLIAGTAGRLSGAFLEDTDSVTWDEDEFGNIMATALASGGIAVVTHLVGSSGLPSVASGSGAGSGPTLSLQTGATDLSGYVKLTTGSAPVAGAIVAAVGFNVPYTAVPKVFFWPANDNAAAQVGTASPQVYSANINEAGFIITQGSGEALQADTDYVWGYMVTQ
jgi:hypothetical protein